MGFLSKLGKKQAPVAPPGFNNQQYGGAESIFTLGAARPKSSLPPSLPPSQPRPSLIVGGPAYFTPEGYEAPVQPEQAFMPTDIRPDPIRENFNRSMPPPKPPKWNFPVDQDKGKPITPITNASPVTPEQEALIAEMTQPRSPDEAPFQLPPYERWLTDPSFQMQPGDPRESYENINFQNPFGTGNTGGIPSPDPRYDTFEDYMNRPDEEFSLGDTAWDFDPSRDVEMPPPMMPMQTPSFEGSRPLGPRPLGPLGTSGMSTMDSSPRQIATPILNASPPETGGINYDELWSPAPGQEKMDEAIANFIRSGTVAPPVQAGGGQTITLPGGKTITIPSFNIPNAPVETPLPMMPAPPAMMPASAPMMPAAQTLQAGTPSMMPRKITGPGGRYRGDW